MSPFGSVLLSINPIGTFIVCVVTRTLMGFLTGWIYQQLCKVDALKHVKVVIANLCAPILNTALFMSTLIAFFYHTEYIQSMVTSLGASNAFMFVIAFVGVNGVIEAALCFVVGSAITKALQVALKNNR